MALEDLTGTGKFITALNAAWPVDDDWVDEGDNHIRGIKNVLKNTFPVTNAAINWSSTYALFPDGTQGAPGIAFTNNPVHGLYRRDNRIAASVPLELSNGTALQKRNASDVSVALITEQDNTLYIGDAVLGAIIFRNAGNAGGSPGATITDARTFKITTTGSYRTPTNVSEFHTSHGAWILSLQSSATTTPYGLEINWYADTSINGNNLYLLCASAGGNLAYIKGNGGINNYTGNNANLSDARVKTGIADAPDHTGFVEQLKFKRFRYTGQPDEVDDVVAQDIEALDPALIGENWHGTDLKTVYSHRLQQRINSVIPRMLARVSALEARVAALEAKCAGH